MANTQFFNDDINIADFRILVSLWDREKNDDDYFLDISNIATDNLIIRKERNMPDCLEMEIEYTQFKEKLNYEGSSPENILMPFVTEIRVQRNFETIFAGTLFHMSLSLSEVGKEILTLKCSSWGQHLEKRYVSEGFHGTYPDIARQMVMAAQHEMNWFDNYAWEYTDDYFQGWIWSTTLLLESAYYAATIARKEAKKKYDAASSKDDDYDDLRKAYDAAYDLEDELYNLYEDNKSAPRAFKKHWDGGIHMWDGESAWTYSMQPRNMLLGGTYNLKPLHFSFWYRSETDGKLTLSAHSDIEGEIADVLADWTVDLSASEEETIVDEEGEETTDRKWTYFETVLDAKTIEGDIHWLKIALDGLDLDISDLNLYTEPENGDAYDLDIKLGFVENNGHKWDNQRVRHYHRQEIKEGLYNLAKLSGTFGEDLETGALEPDTFEYEFDETKRFNIYYAQGALVADPAFAAEYPGVIKNLTLERGLEEICNLSYASSEETKTYNNILGDEVIETKKWASAYSDPNSMQRFGAQVDFKTFEAVHSYEDLDAVAGSDLQIYDEVQDIPEIEIDSNIYNMGNVHLGDAVIVNVLGDKIFQFVNGVYRIYSLNCSISKDSVETVKLTLVPPTAAVLQLISFPKQYKNLRNDIKRLLNNS